MQNYEVFQGLDVALRKMFDMDYLLDDEKNESDELMPALDKALRKIYDLDYLLEVLYEYIDSKIRYAPKEERHEL